MRVLLLSAYHAASHAHWADALQQQFGDFDWTILSLPPRHFRWRIRGNALSWVFGQRDVLERDYDLLLATSMVDLVGLRGLLPRLTKVPTVLYFHENQFAYPRSAADAFSAVELQMLQLYSALAADQLAFNSAYNRDSFLQGVEQLLRKLPDHNPWQPVMRQLRDNSRVLPVPLLSTEGMKAGKCESNSLQLLWNHRWEYDKGPGQLLAAVRLMCERQLPVTLHLVGQQFRQIPDELNAVQTLLESGSSVRLGQLGFVADRDRYQQLLNSCDVVLSTALHDFQGLSVLEAVAAGCLPLLPWRQCYPEWFGDAFLYPSCPDDLAAEACALVDALARYCQAWQQGNLPSPPSVEPFQWPALRGRYQSLFDGVLR